MNVGLIKITFDMTFVWVAVVQLNHFGLLICGWSFRQIFDGFCPRLADSNSKVCCVALDTMKQVIPHIADGLVEVIPELVAKLVKSLASKNNTIYQSSNQILDTLMDHVGESNFSWSANVWSHDEESSYLLSM